MLSEKTITNTAIGMIRPRRDNSAAGTSAGGLWWPCTNYRSNSLLESILFLKCFCRWWIVTQISLGMITESVMTIVSRKHVMRGYGGSELIVIPALALFTLANHTGGLLVVVRVLP